MYQFFIIYNIFCLGKKFSRTLMATASGWMDMDASSTVKDDDGDDELGDLNEDEIEMLFFGDIDVVSRYVKTTNPFKSPGKVNMNVQL